MVALQLLSVIGLVVGVSFSLLCLASGVYFFAQYIEEHPLKIKRYIKYFILSIFATHLVLLLDGLPIARLAFSAATQMIYLQLMGKYPVIDVSSITATLAVVGALVNHLLWFDFFMKTVFPLNHIVAFFTLAVWGTPLLLLISMSNSTHSLPNFVQVHTMGKNRNIIVALLSALFAKQPVSDSSHRQ